MNAIIEKHTDGPWTYDSESETVYGPDGAIGRFEPNSGPLAAAAPDLLKALWPFAKYGEVLQGQRTRGDRALVELWGHKITGGDLRAAAEAVAKVEGTVSNGPTPTDEQLQAWVKSGPLGEMT